MRRMIVLLTTVLLLGSASVAAAECAWVLWEHSLISILAKETIYQSSWDLRGADPSKKECEEREAEVYASSLENGRKLFSQLNTNGKFTTTPKEKFEWTITGKSGSMTKVLNMLSVDRALLHLNEMAES